MRTQSDRRLTTILGALLALVLLAAACGDDSSSDEASDSTDETTSTTVESGDGDDGDDRTDAIDEFQEEVADDIGIGLGSGGDGGDTTTDGDAATDDPVGGTYSDYVRVQDDSGVVSVEVPTEWSDVDGGEGVFGPDVIASTDVQAFSDTFDVPGVQIQATTVGNDTPEEVLGILADGFAAQCSAGPVLPYSDPLYSGVSQNYLDCAGTDTAFVWAAVEPDDSSFIAVVGVQVLASRDIDALGRVLDTFIITPPG